MCTKFILVIAINYAVINILTSNNIDTFANNLLEMKSGFSMSADFLGILKLREIDTSEISFKCIAFEILVEARHRVHKTFL